MNHKEILYLRGVQWAEPNWTVAGPIPEPQCAWAWSPPCCCCGCSLQSSRLQYLSQASSSCLKEKCRFNSCCCSCYPCNHSNLTWVVDEILDYGIRLRSMRCKELPFLKLCEPAYFVITNQLFPHPGGRFCILCHLMHACSSMVQTQTRMEFLQFFL